MRHKYYFLASIIISLLFTHLNFSQTDWTEQTITPTPPKLNCVSTNRNFSVNWEGWIGGDSGTIIYTSNNGNSWLYRNNTVVGTNNVNVIQSITGTAYYYNNSGKVLCSANSSTTTYIYRTSNQGLNWSIVFQQTGGRIRGMYMLDSLNGYALGDPVGGRWTILKTTNGGLSFDSSGLYLAQTGAEISNYNAFYLASVYPSNIILFGTNTGRLYRSTNSGLSWSSISLPFQNDYAVSLGHGYNGSSQGNPYGYAAGNGAVYTTDFGQTWNSVTLPGSGDIHALNCDGGNTCYSKGSQIYVCTNFPLQFTLQYTSPNGGNYTQISLEGYYFEGGVIEGWAVKDNGTVSYFYHFYAGVQKISSEVPNNFHLYQNYPNPFNPITKIKFDVTEDRGQKLEVRLVVYDILGNEVATLVNKSATGGLSPGTYEVEFNGSNYSSGIYFYKLIISDASTTLSITKKLVLLK